MKHNETFNLVALIIFMSATCGCSSASNDDALPEANAENCKPENVMKIRDKAGREAFSARCFRSGKFEPSPNRTW